MKPAAFAAAVLLLPILAGAAQAQTEILRPQIRAIERPVERNAEAALRRQQTEAAERRKRQEAEERGRRQDSAALPPLRPNENPPSRRTGGE